MNDQQISNVNTSSEWKEAVERLSAKSGPSFFHLRAQLPDQGRTNQILAASDRMSVVLKTYASGGENGLHAHTNEDHIFVILQGAATFHGPKGERKHVSQNDCVFLPRGSLYWFAADQDREPLVLLRIGAVVDGALDPLARVDAHGHSVDGEDPANKPVPLVLSDKWFE